MAKTEDVAFAIISAAGDGRAKVAEALKQARRGNFGEAEECLKDADEHLLKAHKLQTEEPPAERGQRRAAGSVQRADLPCTGLRHDWHGHERHGCGNRQSLHAAARQMNLTQTSRSYP